FNSLYINNQNQEIEENYGKDVAREPTDKSLFRRQHVVNNQLFVNQLLSKLKLNQAWDLDLGVGYNVVKADEPDRRTTKILEDEDGSLALLGESNANERYYSDINEKGWSTKAMATYKIDNADNFSRKIEVGYQGDFVKRDFHATIFGHNIKRDRTINESDIYNIDNIFNSSTLESGYFELGTLRGNLNPYWYTADKKVHSAILMGTYQFTDRLTTVLGLRYDNVYQNIEYETNMGSTALEGPGTIQKNYVLPNVNLKYALSDKSNLRAAAGMSYTLPQFVETADF